MDWFIFSYGCGFLIAVIDLIRWTRPRGASQCLCVLAVATGWPVALLAFVLVRISSRDCSR